MAAVAEDEKPVLAMPEAVADYHNFRFWDDFYTEEREPFEW